MEENIITQIEIFEQEREEDAMRSFQKTSEPQNQVDLKYLHLSNLNIQPFSFLTNIFFQKVQVWKVWKVFWKQSGEATQLGRT